MSEIFPLRVSREQGWGRSDRPEDDDGTLVEIPATADSTFGEVWDSFVSRHGPFVEDNEPGGVSWGDEEDEPGYLFDYFGPDGQLYWGQSWSDMRLGDLERRHPDPIHNWQTLNFTFVDYPQMGQGYDLSWIDLEEYYMAIRPYIADGVALYAAFEIIRGVKQGVSEKARNFDESLRGHIARWTRRGGHPYDVRALIDNEGLTSGEKASALGLSSEFDLQALSQFLDPGASIATIKETSDKSYTEDELLQFGRSSSLVGRPPSVHYGCACGKHNCSTRGGWVETAYGLKLGLTGPSDHYTFPAVALSDSLGQLERAQNKEAQLRHRLKGEEVE